MTNSSGDDLEGVHRRRFRYLISNNNFCLDSDMMILFYKECCAIIAARSIVISLEKPKLYRLHSPATYFGHFEGESFRVQLQQLR